MPVVTVAPSLQDLLCTWTTICEREHTKTEPCCLLGALYLLIQCKCCSSGQVHRAWLENFQLHINVEGLLIPCTCLPYPVLQSAVVRQSSVRKGRVNCSDRRMCKTCWSQFLEGRLTCNVQTLTSSLYHSSFLMISGLFCLKGLPRVTHVPLSRGALYLRSWYLYLFQGSS